MMNELYVIYSDQWVCNAGDKSLFLAGPTPRNPEVPSWRPRALEILKSLDFSGTVLVPERKDGASKIDYLDQVEWESNCLNLAKLIVFWVPRNMTTMPALTTNVEFGYWMAKCPEKVMYGRPEEAQSCRYLDWMYQKEASGIFTTLELLLTKAVERLK
jgi:hypothetical protein